MAAPADPLELRFSDLVIDLEHYRVLLSGRPLRLPYREYAMLVYLASRAGQVVSKRRLLEEGLGRHDVEGLWMVDEHITHLKSVLEPGGHCLLEAVEGGYRFICNKELT